MFVSLWWIRTSVFQSLLFIHSPTNTLVRQNFDPIKSCKWRLHTRAFVCSSYSSSSSSTPYGCITKTSKSVKGNSCKTQSYTSSQRRRQEEELRCCILSASFSTFTRWCSSKWWAWPFLAIRIRQLRNKLRTLTKMAIWAWFVVVLCRVCKGVFLTLRVVKMSRQHWNGSRVKARDESKV